jgi:PAS domain S-box-containing protein
MSANARHSLLRRQLKRYFGEGLVVPEAWQGFVQAVDAAYRESDADRSMLERSLELNSQELLQANAEMRALFQAIPDWLLRVAADGTILAFKAGAGDALGSHEMAGKKIDAVIPLSGETWAEAIRRTLDQGSVTSSEYALGEKNEERFFEARLVPVAADELVVIIRNITERRRAEGMRQGQNRILEMIAAGAELPHILASLARLIESQCRGMLCSVLLMDTDGLRLRAGAAPSLPEDYIAAVDGLLIGEGVGSCGTAAFRKAPVIVTDVMTDPLWKDARDLMAKHGLRACWSVPILSNHAAVLGTFAMYYREPRHPTAVEIRLIGIASRMAGIAIERKRAEDALRRAEERFRDIVENAVEGIFQSAPDGKLLAANPAFARVLGYESPAELRDGIGELTAHFVAPERHAEFARLLDERGVVQRFEVQMRRLNGGAVWLSLTARLVRARDGRPTYHDVFAEDITELKQLEEQFRQSQKMEAFGQLAGGVAHDFNNLLTVIRLSVSLLRENSLGPQERAMAIEETMRAAERATNLTRQLLTFSRRQPLQPQNLDLNEVVAGMTKMLQRLIGEHITLEAHYAPGGAPVRADAGMMEQALMNLAVNARDAMPRGGRLSLRTSAVNLDAVAVAARPQARPGQYLELAVSDTGTGIAPEHLPHIFEPFFTTKDIGRGTGLGLATVFGIVEQHQGWIEVESRIGEGTTFRVFLPRLAQTAARVDDVRPAAALPRGHETILIAEDEADVRGLMQKMLEWHGYRVLVATSGVAALRLWEEHRDAIALLITDMVMPEGMTGRELGERLRAEKSGLKVIYCSGYTDEMLGGDSPLRRGANFIDKPFDVEVLLRRVRECLDARPT